jgi:hypothetical protein
MAARETLRLVTELDGETAIRLWLAGLGIESVVQTEVEDRIVYWADGPGMILMAASVSHRAREWMDEQFNLPATLEIGFELDTCRDRMSPQTTIIKGTLEFLRRTGADGGLWFDTNKTLVLMKRGGELTLSDHPDVWTPARLKLVTEAHEQEVLKAY